MGISEDAEAVDATQWRKGLDFDELIRSLRAQIGSFEYSPALQRIWRDVVDPANRYIQETEPFKLAKTDLAACRVILINLAEWLRVAAILIKPFLPRTAETFYRLQLRGRQGMGSGRLRRCVCSRIATGPTSHRPDHRRQAGAALSQDRAAAAPLARASAGRRHAARGEAEALKLRSCKMPRHCGLAQLKRSNDLVAWNWTHEYNTLVDAACFGTTTARNGEQDWSARSLRSV